MILEGIVHEEGYVLGEDGKKYNFPVRGIDEEGYPDVLMDAETVGGEGYMSRQSIKPYIGMKVIFCCNTDAPHGYNYKIIREDQNIKNE